MSHTHIDVPGPGRPCNEHDLDMRIAEKLRPFLVSAKVGGRRQEHTVMAQTSSAAAGMVIAALGWPGACVSPLP